MSIRFQQGVSFLAERHESELGALATVLVFWIHWFEPSFSDHVQQALILVVGSDPKPVERIRIKKSKGSVTATDTNRPGVAGLFELK